MAPPRTRRELERRQLRVGAAVVGSVALHLGALATLVLSVVSRRPPEPPPVVVELLPPSRLPVEAATRSAAAPRLARIQDGTAPVLPMPPAATVGSPPSAGGPNRYENFFRDDLEGCEREVLILLTPEERVRCQARIAASQARNLHGFAPNSDAAAAGGLDLERRAEFAGQLARRRRTRGPAVDPMPPCEGPLANFGAACLPPAD